MSGWPEGVSVHTLLAPGDVETIVKRHGAIYAKEHGFDASFEAYVAGPLAEFARRGSDRERMWVAECGGQFVGCIAIVAASEQVAQLRWFLVDPAARGLGLGTKLLDETVAFCRACGYESIILWTVGALATAASLYRAAGFQKVETAAARHWGVDVEEEKYELRLGSILGH